MLKRKIYLLCAFIFSVFISYYAGTIYGKMTEEGTHVQEVSLEEYQTLIARKASFVLVAERPSCRYCAIVTSALNQIEVDDIPIYILNLEPYMGTSTYDGIKAELQITYLPSFKYISNGTIQYNMNNPLDSDYYDATGNTRLQLYHEMELKIADFLAGIRGDGTLIDEPVQTDTLIGVPEKID